MCDYAFHCSHSVVIILWMNNSEQRKKTSKRRGRILFFGLWWLMVVKVVQYYFRFTKPYQNRYTHAVYCVCVCVCIQSILTINPTNIKYNIWTYSECIPHTTGPYERFSTCFFIMYQNTQRSGLLLSIQVWLLERACTLVSDWNFLVWEFNLIWCAMQIRNFRKNIYIIQVYWTI